MASSSSYETTAKFVTSYLYNRIPRRRVDGLREELSRELSAKIDWYYPVEATTGSRRVVFNRDDPCMQVACASCGSFFPATTY